MEAASVERQVRRIVGSFNAGHVTEALALCRDALRAAPDDPALLHLYGSLLLRQGDHAAALESLEASLARRPENAAAHLLAGRAARAVGLLDAAILHFEAAVPTGDPEALSEAARTLEIADRRAAARVAWQAVRRAAPGSREAAARLGRLSWEAGDPREARDLLRFAVSGEAPASAWFDLGLATQDLGDFEGAATAFRTALGKKPDDAEAAFNLGAVLQELHRLDEAFAAYRQAYRLSPAMFGAVANALTSGPSGALFLDRSDLEIFLRG
ncbi:MAG: tetratricopeptide repeat protein [Pararhizobium sp.]